MNSNQKIVTGSLIGLGIIGLGTLLYHFLQKEDNKQEQENLSKEKEKTNLKQKKPKVVKDKKLEKQLNKGVPFDKKSDHFIEPKKEETKTLPSPIADEFPLRLGSKGKRVERLQIYLMRNFGMFGIIDDKFDKDLEEIVIKRFKKPIVTEQYYNSRKMGESTKSDKNK